MGTRWNDQIVRRLFILWMGILLKGGTIMGEQMIGLIIIRLLVITGGVLFVLFVGEPDIHDAVIELLRSWAK